MASEGISTFGQRSIGESAQPSLELDPPEDDGALRFRQNVNAAQSLSTSDVQIASNTPAPSTDASGLYLQLQQEFAERGYDESRVVGSVVRGDPGVLEKLDAWVQQNSVPVRADAPRFTHFLQIAPPQVNAVYHAIHPQANMPTTYALSEQNIRQLADITFSYMTGHHFSSIGQAVEYDIMGGSNQELQEALATVERALRVTTGDSSFTWESVLNDAEAHLLVQQMRGDVQAQRVAEEQVAKAGAELAVGFGEMASRVSDARSPDTGEENIFLASLGGDRVSSVGDGPLAMVSFSGNAGGFRLGSMGEPEFQIDTSDDDLQDIDLSPRALLRQATDIIGGPGAFVEGVQNGMDYTRTIWHNSEIGFSGRPITGAWDPPRELETVLGQLGEMLGGVGVLATPHLLPKGEQITQQRQLLTAAMEDDRIVLPDEFETTGAISYTVGALKASEVVIPASSVLLGEGIGVAAEVLEQAAEGDIAGPIDLALAAGGAYATSTIGDAIFGWVGDGVGSLADGFSKRFPALFGGNQLPPEVVRVDTGSLGNNPSTTMFSQNASNTDLAVGSSGNSETRSSREGQASSNSPDARGLDETARAGQGSGAAPPGNRPPTAAGAMGLPDPDWGDLSTKDIKHIQNAYSDHDLQLRAAREINGGLSEDPDLRAYAAYLVHRNQMDPEDAINHIRNNAVDIRDIGRIGSDLTALIKQDSVTPDALQDYLGAKFLAVGGSHDNPDFDQLRQILASVDDLIGEKASLLEEGVTNDSFKVLDRWNRGRLSFLRNYLDTLTSHAQVIERLVQDIPNWAQQYDSPLLILDIDDTILMHRHSLTSEQLMSLTNQELTEFSPVALDTIERNYMLNTMPENERNELLNEFPGFLSTYIFNATPEIERNNRSNPMPGVNTLIDTLEKHGVSYLYLTTRNRLYQYATVSNLAEFGLLGENAIGVFGISGDYGETTSKYEVFKQISGIGALWVSDFASQDSSIAEYTLPGGRPDFIASFGDGAADMVDIDNPDTTYLVDTRYYNWPLQKVLPGMER